MNHCAGLSERMPSVAAGTEAWSADEQRHLDTCLDCAAEWRLIRVASGIGARLPQVPAEQLTRAMLARVRAADAADRWRRVMLRVGGLTGLAAAAALVLTVLVREPGREGGAVGGAPVAFELRLAELESASDEELGAVLAEFEPAISEGSSVGAGVEALDAVDVQRALGAWEES